jgi:hypothetical protein
MKTEQAAKFQRSLIIPGQEVGTSNSVGKYYPKHSARAGYAKGALELAEAIKSTVAKTPRPPTQGQFGAQTSGHDWATAQQQRTCVTIFR